MTRAKASFPELCKQFLRGHGQNGLSNQELADFRTTLVQIAAGSSVVIDSRELAALRNDAALWRLRRLFRRATR
jgi:hypothetical protein